ncbi:MAG: UDP-N-acetylglucosamine 1-carboxyvinyltransferase [Patescibacteria group bacterium]
MPNDNSGFHYLVEPSGPLKGEVSLSGAKNAATKIIVASLLTDQECVLENVPQIVDVDLVLEMCRELGSQFDFKNNRLKIVTKKVKQPEISSAYTGRNRIPVLMLGPLIHRCGEARVPVVGGDKIDKRPVDFHTMVLQKMGAELVDEQNAYCLRAKELVGTEILFAWNSVGATETALLSSVLAKGRTVIRNAAIESEVVDLVMVLQKMGAIVEMRDDRTYVVDGVNKLGGFKHKIMPDRIVAASFASAAIASKGDVFVRGAEQRPMVTFLDKVRLAGGEFEITDEGIRFFYKKALRAVDVETLPHPGFMTDWLPPFAILLTQAKGQSLLHDTIFGDRFGYVDALNKMGAKIDVVTQCLGQFSSCRYKDANYKHGAIINGPTPFKGAEVVAPDIRAGFSYLVAAAIAEGNSKVYDEDRAIARGYENILEKFKDLGVKISCSGSQVDKQC